MLAIIGGSGIYAIEGLEVTGEVDVATPYGATSAPIVQARFGKNKLLFLPRHGRNHQFLPHEVNYRANIYALKTLGARQILGFSAVGSLRQEIAPGDFAIPEQYFDFVKGNREKTFFGGGLAAHVSTAVPTCPVLTQWVTKGAERLGLKLHLNKTYACVDGPRLGTRAESHFLRQIGCDLVGMTNVPEVFLAREAQLCYATIGISTDYDCWLDDPSQHVTVSQVISRYGASLDRAKKLLLHLLEGDIPQPNEAYRQALNEAVLTPLEALTEEKKQLLAVLKA